MRALTVLLLSSCFASGAVAQPSAFQRAMATPDSSPAKGASAAMTMPTMIGGKFVVGYEGRGDYVKNAELAKQLSGRGKKTPATASGAVDDTDKETSVQTASVTTKPAPAKAPAAAPKLRSDAALHSDVKPVTTAEAAPQTAPAAPVSPAPRPGAPNYNPMMLIRGGQIVSP